MIVALDPNVIIVALGHRESLDLVLHIWDTNVSSSDRAVKIACDEQGIVQGEYNQYLGQALKQDFKTLEVMFLIELFRQWEAWTIVKPASLNDEASLFLEANGCVTEPEPRLIALAANPDVVLCAVGLHVIHPHVQPRVVVHEHDRVRALRQYLPEFQVIYSASAKAFLEHKFFSDLFELKVAEWIRTRYGNRRYPRVKASFCPPYLKGSGEVDVYGYDEDCEPRRVLVCECKLRMPRNESEWIDENEMSQLLTTWEMVNGYEQHKAEREGHTVRVYPMLVSNAGGITEQARRLARQHNVEIRRAMLPENWHRYSDWRIERCRLLRSRGQQRVDRDEAVDGLDDQLPA